MRPQEIIERKRDGGSLSADQIDFFIRGVCDGSWADYQISALVMAMYIRGLDQSEQDELTRSMLQSGDQLNLSDLGQAIVDKHSTGGVGDKTSIIIAPLLAACGAVVPMISGRGLGHTGGTLDKLESIPAYSTSLSTDQFRKAVGEIGFAMTGQTEAIAPADRKLYALRDATATVSCLPLIVASIMSKKLAEGLDCLILDVKTGSGAFMPVLSDSIDLANALVRTGNNFGVRTEAIVSDMSQPLGRYVGNALEIVECIKILRGDLDDVSMPTWTLSLELSARLLVMAKIAPDIERARAIAQDNLTSGAALEKLRRNIEIQGGDPSVCDDPSQLLEKEVLSFQIIADRSGSITAIDSRAIGNSVVKMRGGRMRAEDTIDHAVGLACEKQIGASVDAGDTLATIFCRTDTQFENVRSEIANAFKISDGTVSDRTPLIVAVVE